MTPGLIGCEAQFPQSWGLSQRRLSLRGLVYNCCSGENVAGSVTSSTRKTREMGGDELMINFGYYLFVE